MGRYGQNLSRNKWDISQMYTNGQRRRRRSRPARTTSTSRRYPRATTNQWLAIRSLWIVFRNNQHTTNTSYILSHSNFPSGEHLHVQDIVSASYPRAEVLVAQSWIHPSKTSPFLPDSFSPSSPVVRPDSQIHGLGHHLSNFSFQIPCGQRRSTRKKFPSAAVFQKVMSAVIFSESFFRDRPSYKQVAPSH